MVQHGCKRVHSKAACLKLSILDNVGIARDLGQELCYFLICNFRQRISVAIFHVLPAQFERLDDLYPAVHEVVHTNTGISIDRQLEGVTCTLPISHQNWSHFSELFAHLQVNCVQHTW
jgi:hypothetical protein